jgi:hypothetical protein
MIYIDGDLWAVGQERCLMIAAQSDSRKAGPSEAQRSCMAACNYSMVLRFHFCPT